MILAPNRNIWRLEGSRRAAVLIDGANYFGALREALLQARSTVFIIGWDLDSRTRLVGESGRANDGYPEGFVDLLTALVNERPQLTVHLLVWDHSVLYALERELFPIVALGWLTPRRIRFCLDEDLPAGASHHQKLVVVDDAVAFCGGLDVTIGAGIRPSIGSTMCAGSTRPASPIVHSTTYRRWSMVTPRVRWRNWLASGGCVAHANVPRLCALLGSLAGQRDARFQRDRRRHCAHRAAYEETQEVREVEALFFDAIDRATRTIYIENQFLTASRLAHHLARRMQQQPELEVVLIVPKAHHSMA